MNLPELLQLYLPLAGLIGMAFWTGVLSQRVRQLEDRWSTERADSLVRLETKVDAQGKDLEKIAVSVEGIHRAIGNIMQGKSPTSYVELGARGAS